MNESFNNHYINKIVFEVFDMMLLFTIKLLTLKFLHLWKP